MNEHDDKPQRLAQSAGSGALERALRAAANDAPSEARLAQLGAELGAAVTRGATPRTSAAPSGLGLKLSAPLVLLGAVAWWLAQPAQPSQPARSLPATTVTAPVPADRAQPGGGTPAANAVVEPAPTPLEPVRKPLAAQPAPPPPPPPADELTLLRTAQAQLASTPAAALDTLAVHAQHYASGALAQEREVLAVDALLSLGRAAQAQARAEALLSAHPDTPHRRRITRVFERHGEVFATPVPVPVPTAIPTSEEVP